MIVQQKCPSTHQLTKYILCKNGNASIHLLRELVFLCRIITTTTTSITIIPPPIIKYAYIGTSGCVCPENQCTNCLNYYKTILTLGKFDSSIIFKEQCKNKRLRVFQLRKGNLHSSSVSMLLYYKEKIRCDILKIKKANRTEIKTNENKDKRQLTNNKNLL